MQETTVTVEVRIMHRDTITAGEAVSDLRKILDSDAGRRLLCEQRPCREHEAGWWVERSTLTVAPDANAQAHLAAPSLTGSQARDRMRTAGRHEPKISSDEEER